MHIEKVQRYFEDQASEVDVKKKIPITSSWMTYDMRGYQIATLVLAYTAPDQSAKASSRRAALREAQDNRDCLGIATFFRFGSLWSTL
jgi:hypothetical protein